MINDPTSGKSACRGCAFRHTSYQPECQKILIHINYMCAEYKCRTEQKKNKVKSIDLRRDTAAGKNRTPCLNTLSIATLPPWTKSWWPQKSVLSWELPPTLAVCCINECELEGYRVSRLQCGPPKMFTNAGPTRTQGQPARRANFWLVPFVSKLQSK